MIGRVDLAANGVGGGLGHCWKLPRRSDSDPGTSRSVPSGVRPVRCCRTMAVLLAGLSALAFGAGDFYGGLSARRMPALWTTVIAQATGLALIAVVAVPLGGSLQPGDLALGVGAGIIGGSALALFYWAMAQGPMSVVAPLSAVTSAVVPVGVGMVDGERPNVGALVGILIALPAIAMISREGTEQDQPPDRSKATPRVSAAATLAGVGFGLFFAMIAHTSDTSGLWPLVGARSSAVPLALVVVAVARPARANIPGSRLALFTGCMDALGNSLFLLASRHGMLALVGVIGAMYPASTVVLARVQLGERLQRHQLAGLCIAGAAVTLIGLSSG